MSDRAKRRAVTAAAVVVALVALAIVAPEVYTGTFSDAATLARAVGLVLVLVGWAWLVRRFVNHRVAAGVLAAGPALVVAALVIWPYVRPATEVDEALPPVETVSEEAAAPETTSAGPATDAAPAPTTTAPPAEPVELRRATFQGLTGHRGSGDAVVYDLGASTLLRFEGVDIGSGPKLEVYLVPGGDQRGTDGATYVAPLTAERGNQNYEVPEGVDLTTGTWTVLVWCETFVVEVANATLA